MSDNNTQMTPEVVERILTRHMDEHKRDRLWKNVFKFFGLSYLMMGLVMVGYFAYKSEGKRDVDEEHVAVVDIVGPIALTGGVNSYNTLTSLEAAFKSESSVAVVLNADSPGGSPSQSDVIYEEILRLKREYPKKPIYTVVGDMCASGCYYIASATDMIYANPTSMIGSIGVKIEGFGFTELMDKLGVERRTLSAGEFKTMNDPYSPKDERVVAHIQENVLAETHKVFISSVKKGRGDRLSDDPKLFSGLVWTGEKAKELGLIDDFANLYSLSRDLTDTNKLHNYTHRDVSLKSLLSGAGAGASQEDLLVLLKLLSGSQGAHDSWKTVLTY